MHSILHGFAAITNIQDLIMPLIYFDICNGCIQRRWTPPLCIEY